VHHTLLAGTQLHFLLDRLRGHSRRKSYKLKDWEMTLLAGLKPVAAPTAPGAHPEALGLLLVAARRR
jgi:hypothetical protein